MYVATLTLAVEPPFRLDLTAWVLRRRHKNTIDRWDGRMYSRTFALGDVPVEVAVTQNGAPEAPQLVVELKSPARLSPRQQAGVQGILEKMLGLSVNIRPFYELVAMRPELLPLAEQFEGMRPTRFPTVFEALVNAIACQQVSLDVGILLLNRLSDAYGLGFSNDGQVQHAFPRPEDLLDVPEGDIKQLGFSYQKARTIKGVAYAITNGDLEQANLETASSAEVLTALTSLRGIGRWSAEYVLLRGLGRLDVFPGDDVGGQNNLQKLLGLTARPGYEQLRDLSASWQPYGGLVYFHLLLNKLSEKGLFNLPGADA